MKQRLTSREFWTLPAPLAGALDAAPGHVPGWRPGWRQAWWWLLLPIALVTGVIASYQINPVLFSERILPEGYGFLEFTQFVECMAALAIALWLLTRPLVRGWPALRLMVMLFAAAGLYIGGEEMSWGQHFFHWTTPDYWSALNRQDETNLHNTNYVFNQLPQLILEIGIAVGGIVLPLVQSMSGPFQSWFLRLLVPPLELLPVALIVFSIKVLSSLQKNGIGLGVLERPSETMELFYYMFIMFYMVILARRIVLLESVSGSRSP